MTGDCPRAGFKPSKGYSFEGRRREPERISHPDIIKLYDDIEDRLYDYVMCVYKEWPKLREEKEEEEIRNITRDVVGDIGKMWIHSPYFNENYPLYLTNTNNNS